MATWNTMSLQSSFRLYISSLVIRLALVLISVISPYDGVLVALYAAGHETCLYDGVHIFMGNPSGYHGIEVDVLYGQRLNGVLIAVFCGFQETAAFFGGLTGVLCLFSVLLTGSSTLP